MNGSNRRQVPPAVLKNLRQGCDSNMTQRLSILIENLAGDDAGWRHLQLHSGDGLGFRDRKVQAPS
ncbi:hypothetical protein D3C83_267950 [compost metagenome]